MVGLAIKIDASEFERAMRGFERQIPFAIALALTRTAQDAQAVVKAHLGDEFTIRTPWIAKGIRIQAAKKADLAATVGSVDRFMEPQAVGGIKTALKGKMVGVPMVGKGRPRPTIKAVTRPSKWPGALTKKANVFYGVAGYKPGTLGVWQRVTRKTEGGKVRGLRLLYALVEKAKILPHWPIKDQVEDVVRQRWAHNTIAAMEHAIKTAK